MKRNIIIGLVLIFILGLVLRFYQLGGVPNSLNWDEVSWGYNAYAIGVTGKDEYGSFLPLSFKAFGDFKQPMYVYLDVVPIVVFGLTGFAVRFPSAIIGSLTILSVFFLIQELFWDHKKKNTLSLITSLFFAISPWSIQFSRVAFEANVGLFFTITGVVFLLKGVRKNNLISLLAGTFIMSLSCYTYHSQKLFTPFLFLSLLIITREFWLKKRTLVIGILGFFLLCNIVWIADSRTTARGRSVLFTSNQTQILAKSSEQLIYDNSHNDVLGKVLHNRRVVYVTTYASNYLSHFDLNYLFIKGDNPRHHPPMMGNLYLVSLPFIILGMLFLWRREKRVALILTTWILLAPVASSLAVDAPNASRSLVFLPVWDILTAFGIYALLQMRSRFLKPKLVAGVIVVLYAFNVIFYLHSYFRHTDLTTAYDWQYGYREAVVYAEAYQKDTHKAVFFSGSFEQPYIFYLFYAKVNPNDYLSEGGSKKLTKLCYSIQNAYFGKCTHKIQVGDLFISMSEENDHHLVKVKEINYPNEEVAIRIYRYQ